MNVVKWVIGGTIGGAIGGIAWIAIAYYANMEVGIIAWGIGLLAGLGVRMAAGDEEGVAPGMVAVALAALAIAVSKYTVVSMQINDAFAQEGPEVAQFSTEDGIARLAGEIVEKRQAEGKEIPPGKDADYETETQADDYAPEIWEEASAQWNELPPDQQQAKLTAMQQEMDEFVGKFTEDMKTQIFVQSFGLYDLLWFGLAALTAFRVGSGTEMAE